MSDAVAARFSCDTCGKTYAWKPELAGKKAKCKCGAVIPIPQEAAGSSPPKEDLYDFAESAPPVSKPKPRVPLAPPPGWQSGGRSTAATVAAPPPAGPMGFPGATQRRDRMTNDVLIDKNRDLYVPISLLTVGVLLYVGFYAWKYQMTGSGIIFTSMGLGLLTLLKGGLMLGFAIAIADKLGVSFGGIFTAALKLAAIAVFCDGVTTWVNGGVAKLAGPAFSGFVGYGAIGFPVALGIYWVLMIYLFSMDSGDSWMVVMLLSVFDYIVKMALMLLLLKAILSFGGVPASAVALPAFGGGSVAANPMVQQVKDLEERGQLEEARAYVASGHQPFTKDHIEALYNAGATKVWFQVSRDINRHVVGESIIIEMPTDKEKRKKVYEALQVYYKAFAMGGGRTEKDEGDPYLFVAAP